MTVKVDLDPKELRLLIQSLENGLGTCETKRRKPDAPCEDCDAARELQRKLQRHLKS
jgi:hypothetical protein